MNLMSFLAFGRMGWAVARVAAPRRYPAHRIDAVTQAPSVASSDKALADSLNAAANIAAASRLLRDRAKKLKNHPPLSRPETVSPRKCGRNKTQGPSMVGEKLGR